jgi:7-keto-8-aminopelargonate synthetase-like enzyme
MDGTRPHLARLRKPAQNHDAWLMVDDAHGFVARDTGAAGSVGLLRAYLRGYCQFS